MNQVDQAYGFEASDGARAYHRSRRMFAVRDGKLHLAPEGAEYSHAVWFEQLGWMRPDDTSIMDELTRGAVEPGGVFAYVGYDLRASDEVERELRLVLQELVRELKIDPGLHVWLGKRVVVPGKESYGIRDLGAISGLV